MKRTITKVPVGDNSERIRVRFEGEECDAKGPVSEMHMRTLLQTVSLDPHIVYCGLDPFETFRMYHNGRAWVVETEATVEKA